mgnify:CR=1 FL=1
MLDYKNYRWFFTSSGNIAVGGKSAEQNEELVKKFIKKKNMIMHTVAPGSPFCILLGDPSENDIEETAIFCASFSHQWKQGKKQSEVHIFSGQDVFKDRTMKSGTFAVKKYKTKKVNLELYLTIQENKLRAVPFKPQDFFCRLVQGKLSKDDAVKKISEILKSKNLNTPIQDIEQAIPSDRIDIK